MRNAILILLVLSCLTGCASAQPQAGRDPAAFVDAAQIVPGLVTDMRYLGDNNFIGRTIAGYEAPICYLTKEAAAALASAQARLKETGFALKVFDCYRPQRAVADFVAWARDLTDEKRKAEHYPNVDKSRLFELGYIAEKSGHSRGSTVDLTIIDARTGAELDMGGAYDLFDTKSWPTDETVSTEARANRSLLRAVMLASGFRPLAEEWWHFTLNGEPYPETFFDFVVQ